MKLAKFEIQFDARQGVFLSGGVMSGTLLIQLLEPMKMRSLKVFFCGDSKSYWDVQHGKDNKTKYRAYETYLHHYFKLFPAGPDDNEGHSVVHPAGTHSYPFSVQLSNTIPSSFEGRRGYVRYYCKATIDRPWKFDNSVKRAFTVIHNFDLNNYPSALIPIEERVRENIEDYCCDAGNAEISLKTNKSGYVPGEPIIYSVHIANESQLDINNYSMELIQITTYTGYSDSMFSSGNPKYHPKEERFNLPTGRLKVDRGTSGTFRAKATVPSLPPSELEGCNIINIAYLLLLKVTCGSVSLKIRKPILIGTVPIMEPRLVTAPSLPATEPSAPDDGTPSTSSPPAETSAPPPMNPPPSYEEVLAPPPSYEECVFGRTVIRDENDDEHTSGDVSWAPAYPYYDWSLHSPQDDGHEPAQAARYIASD